MAHYRPALIGLLYLVVGTLLLACVNQQRPEGMLPPTNTPTPTPIQTPTEPPLPTYKAILFPTTTPTPGLAATPTATSTPVPTLTSTPSPGEPFGIRYSAPSLDNGQIVRYEVPLLRRSERGFEPTVRQAGFPIRPTCLLKKVREAPARKDCFWRIGFGSASVLIR